MVLLLTLNVIFLYDDIFSSQLFKELGILGHFFADIGIKHFLSKYTKILQLLSFLDLNLFLKFHHSLL